MTPTPVERHTAFADHISDLVGGDIIFRMHHSLSTLSRRDVLEEGDIVSFTYGLSTSSHENWRFGRPEVVIYANDGDENWADVFLQAAWQNLGQSDFSVGTVFDVAGGAMSPMAGFIIGYPLVVPKEAWRWRFGNDDLPVNFVQAYPIYREEIPLAAASAERFLFRTEVDLLDVRRAPVAYELDRVRKGLFPQECDEIQESNGGAGLGERRRETDERLSGERGVTDDAVTALAASKEALVNAHDELGMVTHDLRSPLCVITMNAEDIVDSTSDMAAREAAAQVVLAAGRMDRLLRDSLDVVRIESGTLSITRQNIDGGALLEMVARNYRALFVARGVELSVDRPEGATEVSLDRERIVQVLANLLDNALRFTPRGGRVTLREHRVGDAVEFAVRDSGPGIDQEGLADVFDRFWQGKRGDREGLGLGLYICKTIITAHGGTIAAGNAEGGGARFRFVVPCPAAAE